MFLSGNLEIVPAKMRAPRDMSMGGIQTINIEGMEKYVVGQQP